MNFPVTLEERRALLEAYDAAEAEACNADLVERVNAEAEAATGLPRWWPEAAALVIIVTAALSAIFPWGWAS